jgi:hypothetical protein
LRPTEATLKPSLDDRVGAVALLLTVEAAAAAVCPAS